MTRRHHSILHEKVQLIFTNNEGNVKTEFIKFFLHFTANSVSPLLSEHFRSAPMKFTLEKFYCIVIQRLKRTTLSSIIYVYIKMLDHALSSKKETYRLSLINNIK